MKKIVAAVAALVMCGVSAGCDVRSKKSEDKQKVVGISMPSVNLERWVTDGEFLKSLFEKEGYKVNLCYADDDQSRQNNDIISMVDDGVDLLLIAAVDGKGFSSSLDSAMEKGVSVVAYDRLIMDTSAVTYYISFDNHAVGMSQAEYIRDTLDLDNNAGPFNIELVSGDASDNNARVFYDGAYDVLSPYVSSGKLRILSGENNFVKTATAAWATDNAKARMNRLISTYYKENKLDAVLCANDSTALGVVQALEENYRRGGLPIITGQDGDAENLKNIVDGKQSMTVFKNVRDEASVAFEVSKRLLNGEVPTGSLANTLAIDDVTYDSESYNNGKKYVQSYLLKPAVITKDTLQTMVNTGLYKWDDNKKYIESVSQN